MFKYQLGQFGFWKFTTKVKGKYGIETTYFEIEGATLTDQDARHVWLLVRMALFTFLRRSG